jgi:two-component system phosphate regulon sensor histidine kinase PhoR
MASIKAFIEMLMDKEVSKEEEQQRLYGFIDMQVDRLTRLVNNMLNLARIESGVIQVKRENTALNEMLAKTLDVVRPMAGEKSITLTAELSDLYIGVHIDRDLLSQAVINLLSNAIKYTPAGGSVCLRSKQEDGDALIEVHDNGLGIPEEDQKRVFQRFFRVERNSQAAPGTGLGLALVQYIVQDIHNGRVLLRSRVGEGSCFTIALPLGHRGATKRPVGTATWSM